MLAAHQIVLSLASFTFMFPLGISAATATRVGFHTGRHSRSRAFASGWLGIAAGVGIMLISALAFWLIPAQLFGLFSQDPVVIAEGLSVLFLCALFQIFDGMQVVSAGALRGLGDTKTALYSNFVSHWLIGLPLGISLSFLGGMGLKGLWIGLSLGLFCTALINTYFWRKHQTRAA
jgi:MATE family multidrug resistance protein